MKLQQYLFFFLVLTAFSCTTMKKVQVIQEALAKKDTAQLQLVTEIKKVDSVAIVKDILQKICIGGFFGVILSNKALKIYLERFSIINNVSDILLCDIIFDIKNDIEK
jgi:hypothetical protein